MPELSIGRFVVGLNGILDLEEQVGDALHKDEGPEDGEPYGYRVLDELLAGLQLVSYY